MRNAKVTYSDGTVINTSLNAVLTDKEIHDYFKVGRAFNLGGKIDPTLDNMQTVVSCEPAPLKGLIVSVYKSFDRDGTINDCTCEGLSSKVNEITLCGPDLPELFEANANRPAFRVVKRNLSGGDYTHVEPWEHATGNGWMYGGNLCKTSDSRFPSRYALNIHDRQEF